MKITYRPSSGREHQSLTWFENVQLTGKDLFYPNVLLKTKNTLVQPLLEQVQSTGVSTTDETEFDVPNITPTEIHEPVFFFIYNTDNYFHFLYDALPNLIQYFGMGIKLLMNPRHNYRFVQESLSLLGIHSDDIVFANDYTLYKHVVVASSPTHEGVSNEPPRDDIWKVYSKMKLASMPIETPKKIYISRRSWIHGDSSNIGTNYTTRRKMMCEDNLVKVLENNGYKEVFCENLSMSDKIQYFMNATHVVGAIGGGMCNLVFARPSCKVLCICSPEFENINHRFLYTMNHTDVKYFRNTHPVSNLYRRVRYGRSIGEITNETDTTFTLSIGNGVTWENTNTNTIDVLRSSVEFIDNGLNSPWTFDIDKINLNF